MPIADGRYLYRHLLIGRLSYKNTHSEWYEEWSVIRNEEGSVLAGLLLSLNAIDANLDLRAMDLNDVCILKHLSCAETGMSINTVFLVQATWSTT